MKIHEKLSDLNLSYVHALNSAGGISYFNNSFNTVRLGISLYGYSPSESVKLPQGISPALSWKTSICGIRRVKKGDSIGYGRSYVVARDMKIATLTTGYADGYPRLASNKGYVLINGQKAPIVGKICMDMMMVDVTDILGVKIGDVAVLIGKSGKKTLTADHVASWANTISYEILTGISSRVDRVYR